MIKTLKLKAVLEIFLIISFSIIFSLEISSLNSPGVVADETVSSVCCDLGLSGCFPNMEKTLCKNQGGSPINDASCNVAQCTKGCCILGDQCSLETENSCKSRVNDLGIELNYKEDINDELSCKNICKSQENVCCVTSDSCSRTTRELCVKNDGEPFSALCSSVAKCNQCKKHDHKGCDENDPEKIYWYDSCGNREDVFDSCDYNNGFICGKDSVNNDYTCTDLNCKTIWDNPVVDENGDGIFNNDVGTERKNGESWCQFDSNAGPGIDLPGSRHFVHYCYNGKEMVKEPVDYREQICVDLRVIGKDNNVLTHVAEYRNNQNAASCLKYSSKDSCEKNGDNAICVWLGNNATAVKKIAEQYRDKNTVNRTIEVSIDKSQGICVPLVPLGLQLGRGDNINSQICSAGSLEGENAPKVQWENQIDWDCEGNCIAYTPKYLEAMNSMCNLYADCGAKFNLAGVYSNEGFNRVCDINGGKDVAGESLIESPDDVSDDTPYGDSTLGEEMTAKELLNSCKSKIDDPGFEIFKDKYRIYSGLLSMNLSYTAFGQETSFASGLEYTVKGVIIAAGVTSLIVGGVTAGLVAYGAGTFIAGLGVAATLGATTGWAAVLGTVAIGTATVPVIGWVIAGVIIIGMVIAWFAVDVDLYTANLPLTCSAWKPPVDDGKYCHLCYEKGLIADGKTEVDFTAGGLHQCSEYLCSSLGKSCQFKDTSDGYKCISQDCSGATEPILKPLEGLADKIKCVDANGVETKCIIKESTESYGYTITPFVKSYQTVPVGITTYDADGKKSYSSCVYDLSPTKIKYDEMNGRFKNYDLDSSNGLALNHYFNFTSSNRIRDQDSYQFYAKCRGSCDNTEGSRLYKIQFTFDKKPRLESPSLIDNQISPSNKAFINSNFNYTNVNIVLDEKVLGPATSSAPNFIAPGCRWSSTDKLYKDMINKFECFGVNDGENQRCSAKFENLVKGENKFFIKCRDLFGNTNTDSITGKEGYTLYRTNALNITDVTCSTDYGEGCNEIYAPNVTVSVNTINGAEDGKAKCGFSRANVTNVDSTDFLFSENFETMHSLELKNLDEKNYPYYIICEDVAGNIASKFVNMKIMNDKKAPILKSVYKNGDSVVVKTDEISTCRYSTSKNFVNDEAIMFSTNDGFYHTASLSEDDRKFTISCQDRFGNSNSLTNVYLI